MNKYYIKGEIVMKKIVLLCASGMSTSMLVKTMEEAAAEMNFTWTAGSICFK